MKWSAVMAAALLGLALQGAHAGRSCEARPPNAANVQRAMTLAETHRSAVSMPPAHRWWCWRVPGRTWASTGCAGATWAGPTAPTAAGRPTWRVVHKLNQCGSATAACTARAWGNSCWTTCTTTQAAFAVPTPEVQARLLPLLPTTPACSNCTPRLQHGGLPLGAAVPAEQPVGHRDAGLAQDGVAPTPASGPRPGCVSRATSPPSLRISPLVRLGARMSAANVAFDDHPNDKRFSDRIETVTVDSVFEWLARAGLAQPIQVVR
jgi:hypothetical protein